MMFLSGSIWKNFGEVCLWNGAKDFLKVFLINHTNTIEDNIFYSCERLWIFLVFSTELSCIILFFLGITITWLRLLETLTQKAEFGQWFIWQKSNKVYQILIFQKDGYKIIITVYKGPLLVLDNWILCLSSLSNSSICLAMAIHWSFSRSVTHWQLNSLTFGKYCSIPVSFALPSLWTLIYNYVWIY